MNKIVYIGSREINGINSISKLGNSDTFLEYLNPIDFHFVLFSSLYQSGCNYFQLDIKNLPDNIANNPFWKERFIDFDKKKYLEASQKASIILNNNFDFELDKKFTAPQAYHIQEFFSSLFYSTETGIPFINPDFSDSENFDFLESRFNIEFFQSFKRFISLIESDNISTITPKYSVLKKDVRRFEDIANSTIYLNYTKSLNLINESNKIDSIKKEIHSNALKVYNKYLNHLDLKAMTFSFIKTNKKVADLFINKPTSDFGDFVIDIIEKAIVDKKRINYYKVDEANYMVLWLNRIFELLEAGGIERLGEFIKKENEK